MDLSTLGVGLALLVAACYLFLGISILCDEHLCPALEKLCAKLRTPTALAAATFISFGSSAPEIIIAASGAAGNETALSLPAVLVSALIAFGAIPPAVVWVSGPLALRASVAMRDACCYTLGLIMVIVFNTSSSIGPIESVALIAAYVAYIIIVRATSDMSQIFDCEEESETEDTQKQIEEDNTTGTDVSISSNTSPEPHFRVPKTISKASTSATSIQTPTGCSVESLVSKLHGLDQIAVQTPKQHAIFATPRKKGRLLDLEANYSRLLDRIGFLERKLDNMAEPLLDKPNANGHSEEEDDSEGNEEEEEEEEEKTLTERIMEILGAPFVFIFESTMPTGVIGRFAMSLIWLGVLAYTALSITEQVSRSWEVKRATAGATLLAWGGQMPDAIAAVALAKSGQPDAAICQAIASQVINVTIALGLPFLLYYFAFQAPVYTSNHLTVLEVACAVLLSIVAYLIALLPLERLSEWWNTKDDLGLTFCLNNNRAIFLGLTFAVLYAGCIAIAQVPGAVDGALAHI